MEKRDLAGEIFLKTLGFVAALTVVLAMLGAAVYAAINGHDGLAITIFSGAGLAAAAGVFLRSQFSQTEKPAPPSPKPIKQKKR